MPAAAADPELAVVDPHVRVGLESRAASSTAIPGEPSRTEVMEPNSVEAYTCEISAPGNVPRSSSSRSAGLASPPSVICSSGGSVTWRLRASASKKRQKVGVELTQVTRR